MFIKMYRRKGRDESLMVFNFLSIEHDFVPFIEGLKEKTSVFKDEYEQKTWYELIEKIESRCDSKYAKGNVVASASLFEDEYASFTYLASMILVSI